MNLPQPPEGILDQQKPWHLPMPKSPGLWGTLKARLTGRPNEYGNYSSYVNITEADADRLIANMKKDPRGYPQLDQSSGTPSQWMDRQRIYQEWLVENYLENPFREEVDKKIEEAAIESRVNEIRKNRVKKILGKEEEQSPKEEMREVVEDLLNDKPIDQDEVSPEVIDVLPYIAPAVEDIKVPEPIEDDTSTPTEEEKSESPPTLLSIDIQNLIDKYANELDEISSVLNYQTSLVRKINSQKRSIFFNLSLANFIVEQQIENYNEAISDLEVRAEADRTKETSRKSKQKIEDVVVSPRTDENTASVPAQDTEPKQPEYAWYDPRGWMQSPSKKSEGAISTGATVVSDKIIPPGVYDSPTVGQLLPGMAVIPYNRNYGKKLLNVESQVEGMNAVGAAMNAIKNTFLSAAANSIGEFIRDTAALAPFFGVFIDGSVDTLSKTLGIPKSKVLQLLGLDEFYIDQNQKSFFKLWKDTLEKNNWIFGGGADEKGGGGGGGYKGEVFSGAAFIKSAADLRYVGGQNVEKLPAWIPIPQSFAKRVGYTSGFGMRRSPTSGRMAQHQGLDLDGDTGIPIISPFAGKVSMVDDDTDGSGYGKYVEVEHDQPKVFTFYGHLSKIADGITRGATIQPGQELGKMGNTGRSTGVHLHWEIRRSSGGDRIDPVEFTHSVSAGGQQPTPPPKQEPPRIPNANAGPASPGYGGKESGGTVGSFQWGGVVKGILSNLVNRFIPKPSKPKGLKGTPVKRVMHGTKAGVPELIRQTGFRGQTGMLGSGVYASVKGWVADTYRGAGAWKGIVPGQGPRLDLLVPRSARTLRGATVVSERQANRALRIADGILSGTYTGAKAQQLLPLLTETTPGMAQAFGTGALKLLGRGLGVLNAPVVGDMILPEGTSSYDQLSGPNAYYNAPGYSGPKPLTATSTKREPVIVNMPVPSSSSGSPVAPQSATSSTTFVPVPVSTREVRQALQLRRL